MSKAKALGGQTSLFGGPPVRTSKPLARLFVPHVRGSDTSKAAAESKSESAHTDETRVLLFIRDQGEWGATDDEIENRLGMLHQNASARRRGLVLKSAVKDSGKRRPTRSGRAATVWVVVGIG